ncbi:MAG: hypothetical protein JWO95_290 [Verrucomicrobiales bacterium]|nr:hypothetical protein [Verrucomicrobiales bacterium]
MLCVYGAGNAKGFGCDVAQSQPQISHFAGAQPTPTGGDLERCLAAGIDDYVSMPMNKPELLALVGRIAKAD